VCVCVCDEKIYTVGVKELSQPKNLNC
jgi:hypothetical protein